VKKLLLIAAIFVAASSTSAKVWEDTQTWNQDWENKFARWMASDAVHKKMFIQSGSPWKGVVADCADAAYAFRAIFAYENSLAFAFLNPSGSRRSAKTISNRIKNFDRHRNPRKRVIAFINYIGKSIGSESFTRHATFSPRISSLQGGDHFTYNIKGWFGRRIRHVYNIKKVSNIGTFDVIYSSQDIANNRQSMSRRKGKEFGNLPHNPWGFRRFRWPQEIGVSTSNLPSARNASEEQFRWVKESGSKFFRRVKKAVAQFDENDNALIKRRFNNLCIEAESRIRNVQNGVDHNNRNNGRCMNYSDYDTYSTPARDKQLKETYAKLLDSVDELSSTGRDSQVDATTWGMAAAVFGKNANYEEELKKNCSINYAPGKSLSLSELYKRLKAGKLSSHPNDNLDRRWGGTQGRATRCKRWY
jgi:hypothetical protein